MEKLSSAESAENVLKTNSTNCNDATQNDPITFSSYSGRTIGIKDDESEWLDILGSGQLLKKVLKPSSNNIRPERGDQCTVSFTGYLDDGTAVEYQKDLVIHLGDLEVVNGLDLAVALMEEGEEAELIVEPRFAYGPQGLEPKIPPNSRITYKVSLAAIKREPLLSGLDLNKRLCVGKTKKERGNWWYSRTEHVFAIQCYRRALEYFDDSDIPNFQKDSVPQNEEEESLLREFLEERLKTYNNLAQAQIKISAFDGALMSLSHVLVCQPRNIKAIFRKAKILKEQGKIEESITEVRKGLSIQPDSQSLNQELSSLLAILRRNNKKEISLFKKMLGNNTPDKISRKGKADFSNMSSSSSTTWRWLAVLSFAAAAVIGAFAVKYKY